jgi:hypothetical protein
MRRALINDKTGIVENVIEIEKGAVWVSPDGCTLLSSDITESLNLAIGDTYIGGVVTKPISVIPIDWKAKWSAATTTAAQLEVLAQKLDLN